MNLSPTSPTYLTPHSRDTLTRVLPLEECRLDVDAKGGLARVRLVQRFTNLQAEPLSVVYKLPLPADAAVSGFAFRIGERRITGVVEGKAQARETFERALIEGRSAALLEQERSSLFTQEIGNIPPGESIEAEIEIDQPLAWLVEGAWEWRFPLAAAPRYLGGAEAAGEVALDTAIEGTKARASLTMIVRDAILQSPESPSHPLVTSKTLQAYVVELGSGNRAPLDRDVVVRWLAASTDPGVSLDVARPSSAIGNAAYGLLTIVPPKPESKVAPVLRDLTLLIDTSGSMSGEPLAQAKRVASALVDSLGHADQLEMIEFSTHQSSFKTTSQRATPDLKKEALAWIQSLSASGGTEMLSGVKHAMRELRQDSQRQIILITDGLVGFEREIVSTLLAQLPPTARLHALGVGSAVNRSLLAPIARAGRGIEAIVGLGEDAERAAQRLLSRTVAPVVVDVVVGGSALIRSVPSRLPDAYAGCPLRVVLELKPEGGELTIRGKTASGAFLRQVCVDAIDPGVGSSAVVKLFARECVEDLEMRASSGDEVKKIDEEIEHIGRNFGIATRLTSWVAVSDQATVDPRSPSRRQVQPQALPYGMSAEGLGLRQPTMPVQHAVGRGLTFRARADAGAPQASMPPAMPPPPSPMPISERAGRKPSGSTQAGSSVVGRITRAVQDWFGTHEPQASGDEPLPIERRVLWGRIKRREGSAIVIEYTTAEAGEFTLDGATASLQLSDGSILEASVVRDQSTHDGSYLDGVVIRIVVQAGEVMPSNVQAVLVVLANGAHVEAQ